MTNETKIDTQPDVQHDETSLPGLRHLLMSGRREFGNAPITTIASLLAIISFVYFVGKYLSGYITPELTWIICNTLIWVLCAIFDTWGYKKYGARYSPGHLLVMSWALIYMFIMSGILLSSLAGHPIVPTIPTRFAVMLLLPVFCYVNYGMYWLARSLGRVLGFTQSLLEIIDNHARIICEQTDKNG